MRNSSKQRRAFAWVIVVAASVWIAAAGHADSAGSNGRFARYLHRDSPLASIERALGIRRGNGHPRRLVGIAPRTSTALFGVGPNDVWRAARGPLPRQRSDSWYGVRRERSLAQLSGFTTTPTQSRLLGVRSGLWRVFQGLATRRSTESDIIGVPKRSALRPTQWFGSTAPRTTQILGPRLWREPRIYGVRGPARRAHAHGFRSGPRLAGALSGTPRSISAALNRGGLTRKLGRRAFGL